MILSLDYTHIRIAALPEHIIKRLLSEYPSIDDDDEPLTFDSVKEIEEALKLVVPPGKEDLATEWILRGMNQRYGRYPGSFPWIKDLVAWYFDHQKDPLFLRAVQEHMEETGKRINPKNLKDFSLVDMADVEKLYTQAEQMALFGKLPDPLPEGAELVYDGGKYQIVEVTNTRVACALGKVTSWCTKAEMQARSYLQRGPLYIIYRDREVFAQFHLGSMYGVADDMEFKNVKNSPLKINSEIRNLLIGSGFMDRILDMIGQSGLNAEKKFVKFVGGENSDYIRKKCAMEPTLAYFYAQHILKGKRFLEGEEAIMKGGAFDAFRAYQKMLGQFDPKGLREWIEEHRRPDEESEEL